MLKPFDNNSRVTLLHPVVTEQKHKYISYRSQTPHLISRCATINQTIHNKSDILQSNMGNISTNDESKHIQPKSKYLARKLALDISLDKILQNQLMVQGLKTDFEKSRLEPLEDKKKFRKFIVHKRAKTTVLKNDENIKTSLCTNAPSKKYCPKYCFQNFEEDSNETFPSENNQDFGIANFIDKIIGIPKQNLFKRPATSGEVIPNTLVEPPTIQDIRKTNQRNIRYFPQKIKIESESSGFVAREKSCSPLVLIEQKPNIQNKEKESSTKLHKLKKYLFYSKIEKIPKKLLLLDEIPFNNKTIRILLSIYHSRPPTIFFGDIINNDISNKYNNNILQYRMIKDNDIPRFQCESETIFEVMTKTGFINTEADDWILFWGRLQVPEFVEKLGLNQKVNHYPGSKNLGRKDYLWKNYARMKIKFPHEYNYMPQTYLLNNDYDIFHSRFQQAKEGTLWIMKPVASSCGRGIKIINKSTKINPKKGYLVSDYIQNPHLINDIKYDLRIYAMLTSLDPLRIYIYKEGLARFATEKYSLHQSKLNQKFRHLTNFSLNKNSLQYTMNIGGINDRSGSKWSLKSLRMEFEELNINYEEIFAKIKDIIIKTLISVEPMMFVGAMRTQENIRKCFELYGFDILIDENYKPWLMEVNISPSLNLSSPLDYQIKINLIQDIFNLVGFNLCKDYNDKYNKHHSSFLKSKEKKIRFLNELNCKNCISLLNIEEWKVLLESEEEFERKGDFELIFPLRENIQIYRNFFEVDRYFNNLLWNLKLSEKNYIDIFCNKRS